MGRLEYSSPWRYVTDVRLDPLLPIEQLITSSFSTRGPRAASRRAPLPPCRDRSTRGYERLLRFGLATEPAEDRLLDVSVLAHQAAAFDIPNTRTRPVRRACMRDFLSSCCARPTADNASIEASAARMMLQISACSCSGGTGITI
jgi:hypothetical protein